MRLADLHPLDQLYAAYLASQFLLVIGFTAWFVADLERILRSNGGLDLYLNFAFRLLPMQICLYLLWYGADAILRSVFYG